MKIEFPEDVKYCLNCGHRGNDFLNDICPKCQSKNIVLASSIDLCEECQRSPTVREGTEICENCLFLGLEQDDDEISKAWRELIYKE